MTEDQVQKKEATRYQRYGRIAVIVGFVIMALLDVALWVIKEEPDNLVVLVALLPMLAAALLAYMHRTQMAVWLYSGTAWASVVYLTLTNPQSYQEIMALVGRVIFPVIIVLGVSWFSLDKLYKRLILAGAAVAVAVFAAIYGHVNDFDIAPEVSSELGIVLTITYTVVIAGFGYLIVRNFTGVIKWFNSLSLRYKLVGAVLFLFIPTVIVTGVVTANYAARQLEEQAQILLGDATSGLSSTTNTWLEENVHFLNAISEFPGIVSMDGDHQKPVLEAVDNNNPHVFLVQTTNTEGVNVARNDDAAPKDYSDRAWVQGPLSGEELTFQSLISRTIGEPALAVSVPIKEDNGAIVGVLQMAMEFSELTKAVGAVEVGETGVSFVVDANNTLIAHTDQSYFDGEELVSFSTHPAVGALRAGERGIFHYFDDNNNEKMAYLSVLDEFGWGIVTTVDEIEIQAPAREMVNRTARVVVFTILPNVVLIWLMVGFTTNALGKMTEVTEQYASGNYEARVKVNTEDEIGQLGQAFNLMAEQVGMQTEALAERAREMEASQRVTFAASERTTPEDFLDLLVNLIVDQFDVYHSQIYLVDEEHKNAVLSQSTGYAGRVLLQRKHHIPLERESLVTRCINSGEPVLVGNTIETEGWLANELLPYTQSELVVPLEVDGQIIGALDIQAREANRFTDETVPVFESMTEQVAFLYQNNELLENIEFAQRQQQEFVKQLETASQVAGQLTTILDPTQLLDQAVSMLQSNFNFYHAHIYLVDPTGQKLVVQSGSGHVGVILKERGHNIPVDAEKSFVATAFREKMPVRVMNTTQDPNWLPNALLPDTRSEMAVPLITRGQVIGVLDIQSEEVGRFTEVDEDTMLTLAGQLATSVDTARLFTDVEESARQTATRLDVTQALAGNLTEQETLDVLIDKAAFYPEAGISIYYEDRNAEVRTIVSQAENFYASGIVGFGVGTRITEDTLPFNDALPIDDNLIIDDLVTDERIHPAMKEALNSLGVTSLASFPMRISDDLVVHLFSNSKQKNFFDEEKLALYRILSEAGAEALRAAILRAGIDRAAKRTATRLDVTQALGGDLTEEQVLDMLVEKAALYPEARISIYYEDFDAEVRTIEVQCDEPYDTEMHPLDVGYRVSNDVMDFENVLLKDEVTLFDNVSTDDRLDDATKAIMAQIGYTSLMTIPMHMDDDWLGFIFVTSKEEGFFDEEKRMLYNIIADAGTVALRSARLREEREEERARFEALVTYAPDAILLLNYETYMWMDANKNAEAMFGMSREDLLKTGPGALSPSHQPDGRESGEKAVEMISNAVAGGDLQFEWVHTDVNGRAFDCEIRLALLPGDDNVLLVNITDITDRKQAQHAIVQGDRLKSEFLANMSHELRTPLNSILGYTDVLLMGLEGDLEEDVRIDLEAIHENSQHLLGLINDILDLAKIEAGRMTFSLGEVNVPMVLEELQRNNAGLVVGKDVELVVDAPEDLPTIVADERRVYQVINNLVSNAVKFTEKGSITMRAFEEGDEMVLQVEDTGLGIDKENLDAIFEEFKQVDTSSTRQHEGTGLGLTITRRLVHMHGGTIGVESEVNKGSTFTVRIPQEAKVDPELLNALTSSANGNNGAGTKAKAK